MVLYITILSVEELTKSIRCFSSKNWHMEMRLLSTCAAASWKLITLANCILCTYIYTAHVHLLIHRG